MKLNRQTVTYIETLVDEKAAAKRGKLTAEVEAAKAKDKKSRDAFDAELAKIAKEAEKKAEALRRKYGIPLWKSYCGEPHTIECEFSGVADDGKFTEQVDDAKKKLANFNALVSQKKTEVIAKLSLGGTVADLERLIAELKF